MGEACFAPTGCPSGWYGRGPGSCMIESPRLVVGQLGIGLPLHVFPWPRTELVDGRVQLMPACMVQVFPRWRAWSPILPPAGCLWKQVRTWEQTAAVGHHSSRRASLFFFLSFSLLPGPASAGMSVDGALYAVGDAMQARANTPTIFLVRSVVGWR